MAQEKQERAAVYARVTERIVEAIERGAPQWEMPWNAGEVAFRHPVNAATGKRYRGVNVIGLWAESYVRGFTDPTWATFRQWLDLGYPVLKGEKASVGVFWKPIDVAEDRAEPEEDAGEEGKSGSRWIA